MKNYSFTTESRIPMRAALICKGDRWGRDGCFEHMSDIPSIHFFDLRYELPRGQYIASYFLTTFLSGRGELVMHMSVTDWRISAETRLAIVKWLESLEVAGYSKSVEQRRVSTGGLAMVESEVFGG